MTRVRSLLLVAEFEFKEALRSRKALAILLLYLAGALGMSAMFIEFLGTIESAVADQLAVAQTSQPGTLTSTLLNSPEFLAMVTDFTGDAGLAGELVGLPPMALFYGALAIGALPLLAAMTASDAITGEIANGSCRFTLFRTDAMTWVGGKFLGQAGLLAVGVLAGAAGVFAMGAYGLAEFDAVATAIWLGRLSIRAWVYGITWLGIVMGISQVTRSVHWARALAFLSLFGTALTNALLGSEWTRRRIPVLSETLQELLPQAHRLDLWRPDPTTRLTAICMLLALGLLYLSAGHQVFQRRDS